MLEKEISLGEFLRHERERRGITLEQVASSTKVGIRTLHALEGDQFSELPAKPFIRGFVTSYSRFIGLDPKDILTRYDDFINLKSKERPSRDGGHSGYAFEKRDGEHQSRTVLLAAISGFIAVGGIAMLVLKPGLHRSSHRSHIDQLRLSHARDRDSMGDSFGKSVSPYSRFSGVLATNASNLQGSSLTLAPNAPLIGSSAPSLPPTTGSDTLVASQSSEVSPSDTNRPSPANDENRDVASISPISVKDDKKEDQKEDSKNEDESDSASADPLDSGLSLDPKEIKHKVVFKVLQDVWVRYRVDERPMRKFVIRKDRVLVLRAKNQIHFQVSDPNSITFNYNGKGTTVMSQDPTVLIQQETATLNFPQLNGKKSSGTDENPFQGEKPLPSEVPPPPALSSSTSQR